MINYLFQSSPQNAKINFDLKIGLGKKEDNQEAMIDSKYRHITQGLIGASG